MLPWAWKTSSARPSTFAEPKSASRPASAGSTPSTPSPSATTGTPVTPITGCCSSTTTTLSPPERDSRPIHTGTWKSSPGCSGLLVHQDSEGHKGVIYPGLAQRMSAGTGILHSEKNDAWRQGVGSVHDEPVRFVQMWVLPDEQGIQPGYEQLDIADELLRGGLIPVASGMDKHADATAIRIKNRYAALHAARMKPGESVTVPDAPFVHLFVARGAADLEGAGLLQEGDPLRFDRRRRPSGVRRRRCRGADLGDARPGCLRRPDAAGGSADTQPALVAGRQLPSRRPRRGTRRGSHALTNQCC